MKFTLLCWMVLLAGCATTAGDPQMASLQQQVHSLKAEVAEVSVKLEKTNKKAAAANATAVSAKKVATKNAEKVEEVKAVAEKNSHPQIIQVQPSSQRPTGILKPREINHETSLLP